MKAAARKVSRPAPRWRDAVASAATPAELLVVAHDRLRAEMAWLRRSQRAGESRTQDQEMADRLASDAARYLNALSDRIEEHRKAVNGRERKPASQAR